MNVQCSLIWELLLYVFELGNKATDAIKNICYVKDEGPVHHSMVTRWLRYFCSWCKNLNDQARSGRCKTVDTEVVLPALEANLELHSESIWHAQYLTIQCGLSPSWPQQKHPKLANWASCWQNIAKLLTHFNHKWNLSQQSSSILHPDDTWIFMNPRLTYTKIIWHRLDIKTWLKCSLSIQDKWCWNQ